MQPPSQLSSYWRFKTETGDEAAPPGDQNLLEVVPVDALLQILGYLRLGDLARVAAVNKFCHELVQSPALWRSLCALFCELEMIDPLETLPFENYNQAVLYAKDSVLPSLPVSIRL